MIDRTNDSAFTPDNLISAYSRAQAIADGVLIDVTEWASSSKGLIGGFTIPVAVTATVWSDLLAIPERFVGIQDLRGRAYDLLWMALLAARKQARSSSLVFGVLLDVGRTRRRQYKLVIGAGDAGEPVITIMKPEES